jgi:hypothetical protein
MKRLLPLLLVVAVAACDKSPEARTPAKSSLSVQENEELVVVKIEGMS